MVHTRSVLVIAFLSLLAGCGSQKPPTETAAAPAANAPFGADRVEPSSTAVKTSFNPRADGQSALAVFGTSIPANSTVLWNNQALETSGGGTFVAAVVPAKLYDAPGKIAITLRNGADGTVSAPLDFTIYDKTGPAPKVAELYPGTTSQGRGFNVQPDGQSAMGVVGDHFLPGVTLMVDGKKMKTVFGKGTGLSAVIPPDLIGASGSHEVWAVNPDGKVSNKVPFKVL